MSESINKGKRINVDVGRILKNNVDIGCKDFFFSAIMDEHGNKISYTLETNEPMNSNEEARKEMVDVLLEISKNHIKLNNLIESSKLVSNK